MILSVWLDWESNTYKDAKINNKLKITTTVNIKQNVQHQTHLLDRIKLISLLFCYLIHTHLFEYCSTSTFSYHRRTIGSLQSKSKERNIKMNSKMCLSTVTYNTKHHNKTSSVVIPHIGTKLVSLSLVYCCLTYLL